MLIDQVQDIILFKQGFCICYNVVDFSILFLQTSLTETSAPELAKLLYWLMVVGYSIRNIEVRFDMERVLGTPPKPAELPPGENI